MNLRGLGDHAAHASIAPGNGADLIIIRGDVIARPADIRQTTIVFKDGVGYDPAKILASVKELVSIR